MNSNHSEKQDFPYKKHQTNLYTLFFFSNKAYRNSYVSQYKQTSIRPSQLKQPYITPWNSNKQVKSTSESNKTYSSSVNIIYLITRNNMIKSSLLQESTKTSSKLNKDSKRPPSPFKRFDPTK